MIRKVIVILIMSFFLGGCVLTPRKSAIEITSYPIAKVYLDGKEMGTTPYKSTDLSPGKVDINLVSGEKIWNRKITLQNNVNTVIDWVFEDQNQGGGGYILYLEKTGDNKKAGFLVNSSPDQATIKIDEEVKGLSPIRINNIGEGDKHLTLSFPGYKDVEVFMKSMNGYQLVVNATLPKKTIDLINQELNQENLSLSNQGEEKVKVKETGLGWLRVRDIGALNGKEIARINTGDEYVLLENKGDWAKIKLDEDKSGWVSAKYVEKIE